MRETALDPQKLQEIVENSEKLQKIAQETAPQGNILVLPPEVVEALKKVSVLDEKLSNLPQMMKQGFNEYVKNIAKASKEQEAGRAGEDDD